jgi:hypothetical protein
MRALAMLCAVMLSACTTHEALRRSAEVGQASAAVIQTACTEPYIRAAELSPQIAAAEVARLDAMGCPSAARAHDALRAAHDAFEAAVRAHAGELELARASAKMTEAAYALVEALDALRRGAK